jgi:hypothetical protein
VLLNLSHVRLAGPVRSLAALKPIRTIIIGRPTSSIPNHRRLLRWTPEIYDHSFKPTPMLGVPIVQRVKISIT